MDSLSSDESVLLRLVKEYSFDFEAVANDPRLPAAWGAKSCRTRYAELDIRIRKEEIFSAEFDAKLLNLARNECAFDFVEVSRILGRSADVCRRRYAILESRNKSTGNDIAEPVEQVTHASNTAPHTNAGGQEEQSLAKNTPAAPSTSKGSAPAALSVPPSYSGDHNIVLQLPSMEILRSLSTVEFDRSSSSKDGDCKVETDTDSKTASISTNGSADAGAGAIASSSETEESAPQGELSEIQQVLAFLDSVPSHEPEAPASFQDLFGISEEQLGIHDDAVLVPDSANDESADISETATESKGRCETDRPETIPSEGLKIDLRKYASIFDRVAAAIGADLPAEEEEDLVEGETAAEAELVGLPEE